MQKRKWTDEEIENYRKTHVSFFYFNKEDSNFFIPKQYGFGKTVNWANPFSWLFIAVILGIIVLKSWLK